MPGALPTGSQGSSLGEASFEMTQRGTARCQEAGGHEPVLPGTEGSRSQESQELYQ